MRIKSLFTLLFCLCVLVGCGEKNEEAQPTTPEAKVSPLFDSNDKNHVKIAREIGGTREDGTTRELTESDLEKVTELGLPALELTDVSALANLTQLKVLGLDNNKLTEVNGLEKLMQLEGLRIEGNQLVDVRPLSKLTQLKWIVLDGNPSLTKAQIDELQKALPKCEISHSAVK